ncbi:hypothetical protein ANN_25645 [Periplaneta americana]|uniref:Uncharacterized protein n=1 Tax=Periplaneta americana TaxID=6978 RepID=A0ABQ8S3S9_PERAM|nr:hypothetical protein ANN_25645 [Periplaneta americana]
MRANARTDRLDTATCTHTLLSTDVHIRTDHVRYTLRYLHCFSVVSCPHPSDSALNGILAFPLLPTYNPHLHSVESNSVPFAFVSDLRVAYRRSVSLETMYLYKNESFRFFDDRLDDKSSSTE